MICTKRVRTERLRNRIECSVFCFLIIFAALGLHYAVFSLIVASGSCSLVMCRFLTVVAALVAEHQLQQFWLPGSKTQAQQLWLMGLTVLRHVGSSRTKDQTHVPCTGRQTLPLCQQGVLHCVFDLSTGIRISEYLSITSNLPPPKTAYSFFRCLQLPRYP